MACWIVGNQVQRGLRRHGLPSARAAATAEGRRRYPRTNACVRGRAGRATPRAACSSRAASVSLARLPSTSELLDDARSRSCDSGLSLPCRDEHGAADLVQHGSRALLLGWIDDVPFQGFDRPQLSPPVEPQSPGVVGGRSTADAAATSSVARPRAQLAAGSRAQRAPEHCARPRDTALAHSGERSPGRVSIVQRRRGRPGRTGRRRDSRNRGCASAA